MYGKLMLMLAKPFTGLVFLLIVVAGGTALYFYVVGNNEKIETLETTISALNVTVKDKDRTIARQAESFKISEKTLVDYFSKDKANLEVNQAEQINAIETYIKTTTSKPVKEKEYDEKFNEDDISSIGVLLDRMRVIYGKGNTDIGRTTGSAD